MPLIAGAIVLVLIAVVFLVATLVASGPEAQVTSNTLLGASGPNSIVSANDSPTVVRNPTNANNIVVTNRIDRPSYDAGVHWSNDNGNTWHSTTLPLPAGRDRRYAPDAAFASDGSLDIVYVNLEGRGNDPQELWLARSTDGGATFAGPYPITGRYAFQARLAIDPSGTIYVTYLHAAQVGLLTIPGPAQIFVQRSTDHGQTFSQPVQVSDAQRQHVGAATPVIDSGGNLAVMYEDFRADARDFLNLPGPAWESPFALVLTRSTDHGRSFSAGHEIDSGLQPSGRFLVYLPQIPSITAGPSEQLYATWDDARSGADRVYLRRSTDGGQTWQSPVTVTTGISDTSVSAWLPDVSVAPNGRVEVLYFQGHRNTGDNLVRAYLASSADGSSFTTTAVSTGAFSSAIGPLTGPSYLPPDMGSKLSVFSDNGGALTAWTDSRQGTADTGRQDIGFAAPTIGAAPVALWRWIVLVVLLLAAYGLAWLWILEQRRARTGPGRPAVPTATS
jgi:hypothetical protein